MEQTFRWYDQEHKHYIADDEFFFSDAMKAIRRSAESGDPQTINRQHVMRAANGATIAAASTSCVLQTAQPLQPPA